MADYFHPIHINSFGSPDYCIPLTLEYRQEAGWWTGHCRVTGAAAYAKSRAQAREELESNILLQLSELESLSDLPGHLAQWGIVTIPLNNDGSAATAGPAEFRHGVVIAPREMPVKVHKAEDNGYWAEVPDLPGCVSQGETPEQLKANIGEAMTAWLNARREEQSGDAAPMMSE